MSIRVLSDDLINKIAAGEVIERPASVVKELVENSLDAGADQIVIDVEDGGRTLISVIDNGRGMNAEDLSKSVLRHATSKLASDDLLNINTMGFRGEALPSIASVSDMTIDTRIRVSDTDFESETRNPYPKNSLSLNCTTGEIKPSPWESGTRVLVCNLFSRTPARLKFLRSDRAEMMSVVEIVKRLALARPDCGFILNNRWRWPKGQPLYERIIAILGEDARGRLIEIEARDSKLETWNDNIIGLSGFISEPTMRRASSIDQYLFVNGRPVKDKVLIGALRAAVMDVMSAREFPLAVLYLKLPTSEVDVNVSPAKTEVHFLEPAKVRSFIINTLRDAIATTIVARNAQPLEWQGIGHKAQGIDNFDFQKSFSRKESEVYLVRESRYENLFSQINKAELKDDPCPMSYALCPDKPLGQVIGQVHNKYILSAVPGGLCITDQHAAHERITYEKLRAREVKTQPLLVPQVINLRPEMAAAIMEISDELQHCGLELDEFGDDAIVLRARPADWDLDWAAVLLDIAAEVAASGHSSKLSEKLHLKLANYACHHSVRAGQKLDFAQMDALLRDVENTERAGQCNHGRPVYKIITISELDSMFERS
ncbi:DNA mismatch repair protein MutL [Bacteroidia bacterium]|nr:DNA mismatch repair protein MutL [Bacteroidia bacterium]